MSGAGAGRRRLLPLAALVVLCALPVIGAWILYLDPDLVPRGRANVGQLIEPGEPLEALPLAMPGGEPLRVGAMRDRWTLLWLAPRDCASECAGTLMRLRNLRTALREDAPRVQAFAIPLGAAPGGWPQAADPRSGPVVLSGSEAALREVAARIAAAAHVDPASVEGYYLVDPSGRLVMRYEAGADLQGVLQDLQRLLKYTWTGR